MVETLEKGIEYYTKKYETRPDYIECSNKDTDEKEMIFDGITVIPRKFYSSGAIWITNK